MIVTRKRRHRDDQGQHYCRYRFARKRLTTIGRLRLSVASTAINICIHVITKRINFETDFYANSYTLRLHRVSLCEKLDGRATGPLPVSPGPLPRARHHIILDVNYPHGAHARQIFCLCFFIFLVGNESLFTSTCTQMLKLRQIPHAYSHTRARPRCELFVLSCFIYTCDMYM